MSWVFARIVGGLPLGRPCLRERRQLLQSGDEIDERPAYSKVIRRHQVAVEPSPSPSPDKRRS